VSNASQIIIKTITYFICDDQADLQLIDTVKIVSDSTLTNVPIFLSPMLSKAYRKYFDPTKSSTVFMLKYIDYSTYSIQDVLITNESDFYLIAENLVYSLSTFTLGDYYLVMRIDNLNFLTSLYNGY
jgi:hypothetical protein